MYQKIVGNHGMDVTLIQSSTVSEHALFHPRLSKNHLFHFFFFDILLLDYCVSRDYSTASVFRHIVANRTFYVVLF